MTLDEAVAAIGAEGLSASGVRVVIVDTGFVGWEEAVGPVATDFSRGAPTLDSHGTQVAMLVRRVAPDATLTLVSAASEADVIEILGEVDADVVNLSLGWANSGWTDGTSALSRAVDTTDALVVVAAGNEGEHQRRGVLTGPTDALALDGVDKFPLSGLTRLRWAEPFGAADEDLALAATDPSGTCATSDQPQTGAGDPVETLDLRACDGATLRILGVPEGRTEAWLWSDSLPPGLATAGGTLTRPADAYNALTVGAWVDGAVPAWSGVGPTEDGRPRPDVVAPGEVETTLGSFTGTSAAAALVSGVMAAYVADVRPGRADADAARAWLWAHAEDQGLGDAGGAGLVQAAIGGGCATVDPRGAALWGLVALLGCRRRSTRA